MFKKVIIKVHFQQNFNDTKNDSRDNLDSMSVSLANVATAPVPQRPIQQYRKAS